MNQPSQPGAAGHRSRLPIVAAIVAGVLLIVGIRWFTTRDDGPCRRSDGRRRCVTAAQLPPREGCSTVTVAASSEKAALLQRIAASYRDSGRTVNGRCYDIAVTSAASGSAEAALAAGWDETLNGPGTRRLDAGGVDLGEPAAERSDRERPAEHRSGGTTPASVASTPLVLAMPEPMATALGWPDTPIGWSDVLTLARDPQGWAAKGHPEWGRFTLGKTNPNVSTSGLAATIGALVAATGTSSDLTAAALQRPDVQQYLKDVETSVIHYGDTTLTYLENLQRADDAGAALGYLSAVAVEEKSVLDYNAGNPSGDPATLGRHAAAEGAARRGVSRRRAPCPATARTSSWTRPGPRAEKRAGAQDFLAYLQLPEQQKVFTDNFFRTADGAPGDPITTSPSVQRGRCPTALNPPGPDVLRDVRALWAGVRKSARVLLVMDVSGSMSADSGSGGKSKLDLAKSAAATALGQLVDTDQVGFWTFTTGLPTPTTITREWVDVGPLAQTRQQITDAIAGLTPLGGTPLYAATRLAAESMNATMDPASDQRRRGAHRWPQRLHRQRPERVDRPAPSQRPGARGPGVHHRLRTGRRPGHLQQISEASLAAAYDAREPATIDKVFADVLSNF